ncbi:aminoglycoside phosphotransferase family protein [Paenibacillus sp. GYB003]|uniref:aminoglycoside phosphotransferase family protein n=1 Tax=Paenibacillus sp. GYB003 TaxID=2994392 RepID=UPI002F967244
MTDKRYRFKQDEIDGITGRFGQAFYEKASRDIETYADKWALTSFQLIPSYSANLVLTCRSDRFGDAVLKIGGSSSGGASTEFYTLRQYNGRRFCKLFDADLANGVILEERVQPGRPLRDETSLEKRMAVFSSLYNGLHEPPADAELYPTYAGWVGSITDHMSKRTDCRELYAYMKKAHDICLSVSAEYSRRMLLHGDFHHDNILLGAGGEYVIIDPKGVIGDPVFDVPRFILNEFEDEITPELYEKINKVIAILENHLQIPDSILRQCVFVETAMGVCWSAEDGPAPGEYPKLVRDVAFAEAILNAG